MEIAFPRLLVLPPSGPALRIFGRAHWVAATELGETDVQPGSPAYPGPLVAGMGTHSTAVAVAVADGGRFGGISESVAVGLAAEEAGTKAQSSLHCLAVESPLFRSQEVGKRKRNRSVSLHTGPAAEAAQVDRQNHTEDRG